jgi:hypothetical protein
MVQVGSQKWMLEYSQIWFNWLTNDGCLGYIAKLKLKKIKNGIGSKKSGHKNYN